jgi:hypothetical protein
MATARTSTELRRWRNLAIIQRAIAARMPELQERVGLKDVAELCRRHALAQPRDWNDVRDGMLMICCEWDLAKDALDAQSDACLDCLARFLG